MFLKSRNIVLTYLLFNVFVSNPVISQITLESHVIASFPTPGSSPQGLAWDGEYIWMSDDSTDTIYKLDPWDGSVLLSFASPGPKSISMTSDTTSIWCLDDSLRYIYKLDKETGAAQDSIPFPAEVEWLPTAEFPFYGVAWDGHYFYVNFEAGWSSQIVRMDVENDTAYRFSYTSGSSRDLTYDGVYIWNSCNGRGLKKGWVAQYTYQGRRQDRFDTPGYYPTGVTYDGNTFWVTDNSTDSLYQIEVITTGIRDTSKKPHNGFCEFILYQNYPNPFNNVTRIKYQLNKPAEVTILILDITGREVKRLVKLYQSPGNYHVVWDGKDNQNLEVPSGLYLYTLRIGDKVFTKKLMLMK